MSFSKKLMNTLKTHKNHQNFTNFFIWNFSKKPNQTKQKEKQNKKQTNKTNKQTKNKTKNHLFGYEGKEDMGIPKNSDRFQYKNNKS